MKNIDMRLDENLIKNMIGNKFVKYKCDDVDFTNSVTQIVGLYIGDKVYKLSNIQNTVSYFGEDQDIAVYKIEDSDDSLIVSAFKDTKQINTPIDSIITEIKLINETQTVKTDDDLYNVLLTRAIIFYAGGREISFEKDNVPFSEEIIIRRGYELINELSNKDDFLEGWDDEFEATCYRESIVIK